MGEVGTLKTKTKFTKMILVLFLTRNIYQLFRDTFSSAIFF